MITFRQKGDFSTLTSYLERVKGVLRVSELDYYGRLGVDALSSMTPKDTGKTANAWRYEIVREKDGCRLQFYNDNVQNGINIAVILQYGHATRNGGWVEGRDYINPALRPIFDKIAEDAWKEVTRV